MNQSFSKKILRTVSINEKITVTDVKLEIKKSTNLSAGSGVFATEFIPKDTVFLCSGSGAIEEQGIGFYINDLAYDGNVENYKNEEKQLEIQNVGFMKQCDELYQFFGVGQCTIYLVTLKDINAGEELSKYYGLDYWLEYNFWNNFPGNKYRATHDVKDLPNKWVFIDNIRVDYNFNHNMQVFAKKVDDNPEKGNPSDKYFYMVGYGNKNICYHQNFDELSKDFKDITKPDFSPYLLDEAVYDRMHFDEYNMQKYYLKREFWDQFPEKYINYEHNRDLEDLPDKWVFIDYITEGFDTKDHLAVYAKKLDDKIFYLIGDGDEYMCYEKNFDEMIKSDDSFKEITKSDYSQYAEDEMVYEEKYFSRYLLSKVQHPWAGNDNQVDEQVVV